MQRKTARLLLTAAAVTISGAAVLRVSPAVLAHGGGMTSDDLVQKIAQRFSLNEADVQAVFDEERAARDQEMQTRLEEELQSQVDNGELTTAQKDAITAKRQELEAARSSKMEEFSSLSQEERKAAMEQERSELEAWAESNGIDMKYLMMGRGGKGMHHGGGPDAAESPADE
ncbi:MAG: hypothetical protein H6774_00720 [Pseudomonadales bacterium]|nr:hypothetical protein [Pseudomonadales bacterium]